MNYVTYSDLFQFAIMITAIIAVFVSLKNRDTKK